MTEQTAIENFRKEIENMPQGLFSERLITSIDVLEGLREGRKFPINKSDCIGILHGCMEFAKDQSLFKESILAIL